MEFCEVGGGGSGGQAIYQLINWPGGGWGRRRGCIGREGNARGLFWE